MKRLFRQAVQVAEGFGHVASLVNVLIVLAAAMQHAGWTR